MAESHDSANLWLDDGEMSVDKDDLTGLLDAVYQREPSSQATNRAIARTVEAISKLASAVFYYDVIQETPFGPIYIAMSDKGVTVLGFDDSEDDFLDRMRRRYRVSIERSSKRFEAVRSQMKAYFEGTLDHFDLPLDLSHLTIFQHRVLRAIQEIPPGETISYGGLARLIGKPGAARAVGRALGSNPIPIIIPCHRVLAADGSLGGYSGRGGVRTKQALLTLEGA